MNLREAVSLIPEDFIFRAIDGMSVKELQAALIDVESPEFSKRRQELKPRLENLLSAKLEARAEERHRLMCWLMIVAIGLGALTLLATIIFGLLK